MRYIQAWLVGVAVSVLGLVPAPKAWAQHEKGGSGDHGSSGASGGGHAGGASHGGDHGGGSGGSSPGSGGIQASAAPAPSTLQRAREALERGRIERAGTLAQRAQRQATSPSGRAAAAAVLAHALAQPGRDPERNPGGRQERLRDALDHAVREREPRGGPSRSETPPGKPTVRGHEWSQDRALEEAGRFKHLWDVCETVLNGEDSLRLRCLEGDARLLLEGGDLAQAERLFERLVGEAFRLSETNRLVLARGLGGLGAVRLRGLDLGGARLYFERALAIAQRLSGEDSDRERATSLNNLGSALAASGEYGRARQHYERAVGIWERGGAETRSELITGLDNLARVLWTLGDYAGAQRLYERALALAEEELEGDRLSMAANLGGYGRLLYSIGDYARARSFLERARSLAEQAGGRDHPILGVILSDLGNLTAATGDLARARVLYAGALRIFEAHFGTDHPYVAASVAHLATLNARRNPRDARRSLEKALAVNEKVFGPDHPDLISLLRDLATIAIAEGRAAAARPLLERALTIQEKSLTPEHPSVAHTLNRLAWLHGNDGDRLGAVLLFERALAIQEKALGDSHPDLAFTLYGLARNRACTTDLQGALEAALRAEAISGRHLSVTAQRLSEADALNYASVRVSALDVLLSLASEGLPPEGLRSVWDAVIRSRALVLDAVATRRRAAEGSRTPEGRAAAADLAEASRRLSNLIVRGPAGGAPSIEAYRSLLDDAREARDAAERGLAGKVVAFRRDIDRRRAGLSEVALALPRDSALVAYVRYNRYEWSAEGGCASAPRFLPSYAALVLRSGGAEVTVRPLGAAPLIDAHLAAWRKAVVSPPGREPQLSESAYRDSARPLRRLVWDPVAAAVGDAKRVFIVPDGPLHLLNWAALPADDDRYLAEAGPLFHYLSAERDLVREEGPGRAGQGILVVGGPAFDDPNALTSRAASTPSSDSPGVRVASATSAEWEPLRGPAARCERTTPLRFEPLPGAAREAAGVASLWKATQAATEAQSGGATLLVGAQATESAFKAEASMRRVLHLATHGFFLGATCPSPGGAEITRGIGGLAVDEPATPATQVATSTEDHVPFSGLALAGANQRASVASDEDDGILTAEEIAAMDLSGVEWAVLSACDTGVGEIRAGEGVFGLRRAFQVAGAGSMIMSLWSVGDDIAERWMLALYKARLEQSLETAEAVRSASLRLLEDRRASGETTHPFYWAAFVAAGDWR